MNRYLWAVGNDRNSLKLATLCQFSLGGPPVIYYGTEVGLSQERDVRQDGRGILEESRLPMLWDEQQDKEMLSFYQNLIALRQREPALRSGSRHSLPIQTLPAGDAVVAFQRQLGSQALATVINLSHAPVHVQIPGQWKNVVLATQSGSNLTVSESLSELDLPAQAGVILK